MLIKNIMTKTVFCAAPDDTLISIAQKMRDEKIGAIPVCNSEKVVGFVTDRDIVTRAVAKAVDFTKFKVKEIMTKTPFTVWETDTVEDAVELMEKKHIRRLPVLSKTKKLVGLISLDDIATHSPHELTGEAFKTVSWAKRTPTVRPDARAQEVHF